MDCDREHFFFSFFWKMMAGSLWHDSSPMNLSSWYVFFLMDRDHIKQDRGITQSKYGLVFVFKVERKDQINASGIKHNRLKFPHYYKLGL